MEVAHIDILELQVIETGIQVYYKNRSFTYVGVICDDATTISYINNTRSMKSY